MHPSSESASTVLPERSSPSPRNWRADDIVYQAVTIGAILLVLGSVWVF